MKRILITGASGFIGRQTVLALRGGDYEIHTVQHTARQMSDSRNHTVNLMDRDQVARLMERVKPSHLMHLAWYAEHGKFWTSPLNLDWVSASINLFQAFVGNGGQRAVFAGSCAEYDWQPQTPVSEVLRRPGTTGLDSARDPALRITSEPASGDLFLHETNSPSNPATLYGVCKNSLWHIIEKFAAQSSVSVAWGRIFFLFGRGEHPNRLIPSILNPLLNDQPAIVRSGGHVRNLMHVEDVARAFVHILNSPATGIVNVASPEAVSLGDVACMLGEMIGRPRLVKVEQAEGTPQNPRVLTADTAKLIALGFVPEYSLRQGLSTLLNDKETL